MRYLELFLKFFRLGITGWGGPIGRIALLHEELVVKDKWIDEKKFAKVLAVYQALPGPEATELACYFGYLKKGRWGCIAAGLGFMLPGFLLMLLASYLYLSYGIDKELLGNVLYGIRPVVLALILHATIKLGKANITDAKLLFIAVLSSIVFLFTKLDFLLVLIAAGILSLLIYREKIKAKGPDKKGSGNSGGAEKAKDSGGKGMVGKAAEDAGEGKAALGALALPLLQFYARLEPSHAILMFLFFLKAGLLTFGGAYSVVPFVQQGAVYDFHWITNEQYIDGLAIGAALPAPLVIIGTFAGYLAGGFAGAVIATVGIFLPAFAFTLFGYGHIERVLENKKLQYFLAGLTASIIGLIAATGIELAPVSIVDVLSLAFAIAAFFLIKRKYNFLLIVLAGGSVGFLFKLFL